MSYQSFIWLILHASFSLLIRRFEELMQGNDSDNEQKIIILVKNIFCDVDFNLIIEIE